MASAIPNTLVVVTGLRNIKREKLITAILFEAFATAYVKGETKKIQCNISIVSNNLKTKEKRKPYLNEAN